MRFSDSRGRRSSIQKIAAAWLLAAAVAACGLRPPGRGHPSAGAAASPLRYLDGFAVAPGTLKVPGSAVPLGSLSGLAYDARSGRWVSASDATPPRLAWFDVSTTGGRLSVTPVAFTLLTAAPGLAHPEVLRGLDMESLVAMPDGSFATTNEGYTDRVGVVHQPAVLLISRGGLVTDAVFPRPHFLVTAGETTHGVRHNLGFEGLTRTPDGRLVAGMEQPLAQDGPMSTASAGGRVRFVEFVPADGTWHPAREWVYRLDPTPRVRGYGAPCQDGDNGLSDMLAVDDHRFLVLERACLVGAPGQPALNPVRIYLADTDGAEDVADRAALGPRPVRLVAKHLLLDLMTLRSKVPPALRTLSNYEGLAIGPPSPSAASTLLLVSDDNFRASQTLSFMWLAR